MKHQKKLYLLFVAVTLAMTAACNSATPTPLPTPAATLTPTTLPTITPGGIGVNVPDGWHLVFSDEFDTLDTNAWTLGLPPSWPVDHLNDELECYQPGQVSVSDGILILQAIQSGCDNEQIYPSGAVASIASYQYGYFEARIKLPKGKGYWPAFWLSSADDRWPPEWDIFEVVSTTGEIHQYPHPVSDGQCTWVEGASGFDNIYSRMEGAPSPFDWVSYGLSLTGTDVIWYVDGVMTGHFKIDSAAGADDHYWVLLNLAVGGAWPGRPDNTTPWPGDMQVDYVKIWQP